MRSIEKEHALFENLAYNYSKKDVLNLVDVLTKCSKEEQQKHLKETHPTLGSMVNLKFWIKSYQKRFSIMDIQEFSKSRMTMDEQRFEENNSSSPSKTDLEKKLVEIQIEIIKLNERIKKNEILIEDQKREITFLKKRLLYLEEEIQLNQESIKQNKKRLKKLKLMVYILVLTSLLSLSNFRNRFSKSVPVSMEEERDIENAIEELPIEEKEDLPINEESEKLESLQESLKFGKTIKKSVSYYLNSVTHESMGVTDKEGYVVGYFATLPNEPVNTLIGSFRSQAEIDEFLQGNVDEIIWKCAICTTNNEIIEQMIGENVSIPYTYTTCFADAPIKKRVRGEENEWCNYCK